VKVLNIERVEGKRPRIALSIKAASPDPWNEAGDQFWDGKKTSGTVVRLAQFGAFVELTPGIEGLVHVSEIARRPLRDPGEELTVGQRVDVSVLKVDLEKRRISLSIRELLPPVPMEENGAHEGALAGAPEGAASAAAPRAPERTPKAGDIVDAVVRNIKPYGIFADLPIYGPRVSGLIPHDETGERRGTDLARRFNVGDPLKVFVLDAAEGKIRLSLTALQSQEERRGFEEFRSRTATKGNSTAMEDAFRRAMGKN
jgi:small subunit ribosomal protein S1